MTFKAFWVSPDPYLLRFKHLLMKMPKIYPKRAFPKSINSCEQVQEKLVKNGANTQESLNVERGKDGVRSNMSRWVLSDHHKGI